ncbi:hypothetical protein OH77DRAFT_1524077 [Trametes cingulata]|nr:hypothetical protein OH77DRAFT_1524077 [Trametes cingulata]
MKHIPLFSVMYLALGAPAALARLFTFPTNGTQLAAGRYTNVTWDPQVLVAVFGPSGMAVNSTAMSSQSTDLNTTFATRTMNATAVANASFTPVVRRQESNSVDISATPTAFGNPTAHTTANATTSGSSATLSEDGSSLSVGATNSTGPAPSLELTATSNATTPSTASANPVPESPGRPLCVNGMPTRSALDMNNDGRPLLCSTLQLFRGDDLSDPLFVATNFDVSTGWLELLVPYDAEGSRDEYIFMFWVRDGEGADAFWSDTFDIMSPA